MSEQKNSFLMTLEKMETFVIDYIEKKVNG